MAVIKGRYASCEISENGSAVKLRTVEGDSIRLSADDWLRVTEDMVKAGVAGKLNAALRPERVGARFEPTPFVIYADDLNGQHMPDSGGFSIEITDAHGERGVFVLNPEMMEYLVHLYQESKTGPLGQASH